MLKKGIMGILVLAVLTLALGSIACDGDQVYSNSARALQAAKETWSGIQDQTGKTVKPGLQDEAAEMRKAGRLTDAQWESWIQLDAKYRASHNATVQALKVYQRTKDKPAAEALAAALSELTGIIRRGSDLIAAFKGGV